jgi:mRNA-degrading endonuclease RelE of RelBE toxin-antitoxin system
MAVCPASMWKLELIRSARDEYDALSDSVRGEALILLEELAEDPFPEGVLALRGHRDHYRLRFYGNQYRVIYIGFPKHRRRS